MRASILLACVLAAAVPAQKKGKPGKAGGQKEVPAPQEYSFMDYDPAALWLGDKGGVIRIGKEGVYTVDPKEGEPLRLPLVMLEKRLALMPKYVLRHVTDSETGVLRFEEMAGNLADQVDKPFKLTDGFETGYIRRGWFSRSHKLTPCPEGILLVCFTTPRDLFAEEFQVHWASKDGGLGHLLRVIHHNRDLVAKGAPLLCTIEAVIAQAPYPGEEVSDWSCLVRAVEYHPMRGTAPPTLREHHIVLGEKIDQGPAGGRRTRTSRHLVTEVKDFGGKQPEITVLPYKKTKRPDWLRDEVLLVPHRAEPVVTEAPLLKQRWRWERPGVAVKDLPSRGGCVLHAPLFWFARTHKWKGMIPSRPRQLHIDDQGRWVPRTGPRDGDIRPITGICRFPGGRPTVYAFGKVIGSGALRKYWRRRLAVAGADKAQRARVKAQLRTWLAVLRGVPHAEKYAPTAKGIRPLEALAD